MDTFIILLFKALILIVLTALNNRFTNTERHKKINRIVFVVSLILALLSAFGQLRIDNNTDLLLVVIDSFLMIQIALLGLQLAIKLIIVTVKRFRTIRMDQRKVGVVIMGLCLFSAVGYYLLLPDKLCDCELNFLEGNNISEESYRRIQDDNRRLNFDELMQLAGASGALTADKLQGLILNEMLVYAPCLKQNIAPNKIELLEISENLIQASNDQTISDNRNKIKREELGRQLESLLQQKDTAFIRSVFNYYRKVQETSPNSIEEFETKIFTSSYSFRNSYSLISEYFDINYSDYKKLMGYEAFNKARTIKFENDVRLDSLNIPYIWNNAVEGIHFKQNKKIKNLIYSLNPKKQ